MPDGHKSYKVGNDVYDIPNDIYKSFLKQHPNAMEVNSFSVGEQVFDIPVYNVNEFIKANPHAKPFELKPAPSQEMVFIEDNRGTDSITGMPVGNKSKLTTNASTEMMKQIVAAAKSANVDPYTALAIAHQETGFDNEEMNPMHVVGGTMGGDTNGAVVESMKMLKEKFDYANKLGKKDEASIIQAWNGYGKIGVGAEGYGRKFYGVDVTQPMDMNKNPIYGKRIIDIRDNILKKNKDVVNLVNTTNSAPDEFEQYKVK